MEFTPESVGELHAIDGFDIVKVPSETYSIEVDFGPDEERNLPGLIDSPNGEYLDALRTQVVAYSAVSLRHPIGSFPVPPGQYVRVGVGNSFKSYKIFPYTKVEVVAVQESDTPTVQNIIDYGDISIGSTKISFRLAGKSAEHPDWGGVPGQRYIIVFKLVTNFDNVYWRVGFVAVKPEQ